MKYNTNTLSHRRLAVPPLRPHRLVDVSSHNSVNRREYNVTQPTTSTLRVTALRYLYRCTLLLCDETLTLWCDSRRKARRRHSKTRIRAGCETRQCRINANRGPWQLFARGPLLTRDKDLCKLYACERVDTRQWHEWYSQPLESTRHAGNYYFVPISTRPIFIFCCKSYVKLLDY